MAVEPGDSWWHGGELRMRLDQARDRACAELGWHITRDDEDARRHPRRHRPRRLLAIYRRRADLAGAV